MAVKLTGKILVVDDDPTIRHLCSEILSSEGYQVETAKDGREALEVLKDRGFSLVITDVNMPGLDGIGLYKYVSQRHTYLKDSFLFMTGYVSGEIKSSIRQLGKTCIFKPFRVSEFLSHVNGMMSENPGCEHSGKRQEARFRVAADCGVLEEDTNNQRIIVAKAEDVSRNGLKIRFRGEPLKSITTVGVFIKLNYLNLLRDARIIWSKPVDETDSEAGLRFLEPIPASSINCVMSEVKIQSF